MSFASTVCLSDNGHRISRIVPDNQRKTGFASGAVTFQRVIQNAVI